MVRETRAFRVGLNPVRFVCMSSDGRSFWSYAEDLMRHRNLASGEVLMSLGPFVYGTDRFACSSIRQVMVAAGPQLEVWDMNGGTCLGRLGPRWDRPAFTALAVNPAGDLVVCGQTDKGYARYDLPLWDVVHNEEVGKLEVPTTTHATDSWRRPWTFALAFSADGRTIASGHETGEVTLWSTESHELLFTLKSHGETVRDVSFGPSGEHLISGSQAGEVVLWDLNARKKVSRWDNLSDSSDLRLAFSPSGRGFAALGPRERTIRLFGFESGRTESVDTASSRCSTFAFSPDGGSLISGHVDGYVRTWDLEGLGSS